MLLITEFAFEDTILLGARGRGVPAPWVWVAPLAALIGRPHATAGLSSYRCGTSFCCIPVVGAEHVVGPLLVADHVFRIVSRRILWRPVRPDAGRDGSHWPIDIAVAAEGEGVALTA